MASDYRVSFPVVGAVLDAAGKPVLNPITETVPVRDGYAKLSQVPFYDSKVSSNVVIPDMTEIATGAPAFSQYRVNYTTGRVYFHESANTTAVKATYQGKGTLVGADEINWLWENVNRAAENLFYVSLNDTPTILLPRAVQVADPTGTKITQMSPEIGRSHSETVILRNFPGTYRVQGSIFDWITAWKLIGAELQTETTDISSGYADTLQFSDGKYRAVGADGHFYSTMPVFIPGTKKIASVTIKDPVGDIGVLVAVGGVYHQYKGGEWVKIGTLNSIRSLPFSEWNTLADYAGLPPSALALFNDNTLNFAVYCLAGSSFAPSIVLRYGAGFGYEKADFNAVFDRENQEWEVTMPSGQDYALIIGSGKDDVSCTSEVLEFADVLPGETVAVKAPIRTNINVLIGDGEAVSESTFPNSPAHSWVKYTPESPAPGLYTQDVVTASSLNRAEIVSAFAGTGITHLYCPMLAQDENISPTPLEGFATGEMRHGVGCTGAGYVFGGALRYGTDVLHSSGNGTTTLPGTFMAIVDCLPTPASKPVYPAPLQANYYGIGCWTDGDNALSMVATQPNSIGKQCQTVMSPRAVFNTGFNFFARTALSLWGGLYQGIGGVSFSISAYLNGVACSASILQVGNDSGCARAILDSGRRMTAAAGYTPALTPTHPILLWAYTPQTLTTAQLSKVDNALRTAFANFKGSVKGKTAKYVSVSPLPPEFTEVNNTIKEPTYFTATAKPVLYAFALSGRLYTVDRTTNDFIEIPVSSSYDQLISFAADAQTVQAAIQSGKGASFKGANLVIITKDWGENDLIGAVPGGLSVSNYLTDRGLWLATNSDVTTTYRDSEWRVTNNTGRKTKLRLAILGGGLLDNVAPEAARLFTELLDTPADLNDLAPKALVSHNGSVVKASRVHPYLLGSI